MMTTTRRDDDDVDVDNVADVDNLPDRIATNNLPIDLRRLHPSKKNNQKIIVIRQIIGSGKIDSFRSI